MKEEAKDFPVPHQVNGTWVTARLDDVMEIKGERWVTLVPVAEGDPRLWEFSLVTGRLIQTRGAH